MKSQLILIYALGIFLLSSCQTSPTGRRQLTLLPDDQLNAMGEQAFSDMKQKLPIYKGTAINQYVKCVANRITQEAPGERNWEVVVFENPSPNAFALPGGKIGVYTSMLQVAQTPAQLASVLGHEVAHVTVEHSNERVSQELALQGGLALASVIIAEKNSRRHDLIMGALGLGAVYGVQLPHGRSQETEADIVGLEFMAKAGFDPRASVELWQNMEKMAQGPQPPEFLSTHPSHGSRIKTLNEKIPEFLETYKGVAKKPDCKVPEAEIRTLSMRK